MKWLNQFSLKRKFMVLSFVFLFICLVLTSSITLNIKNLLFEKQLAYATSNALRFKSEIQYTYKKVSTIYDFLQFDKNIELLFSEPFSVNTKTYLNAIDNLLLALGIMNEDIADIALVHKNFSYSNLFDDDFLRDLIHSTPVHTPINSLGIRSSTFLNALPGNYLVFHKNIFTLSTGVKKREYIGDIVISINLLTLNRSLPQDTYGDTTYFMLIDPFKQIYPVNCSLEEAAQMVHSTDILSMEPSATETLISENEDFLIYTSYIPELKYSMVSVIDKNKLMFELKDILFLSSLVIALVIIFICISIYLVLSNILNPLHNMYLFIKDISRGNIKNLKSPLTLEGSTEITTLSSAFNIMMSEINSLNKQLFTTTTRLYELEIQKNKAEILHLRSQINPHFLYNTLESIRGLALESHSPKIAQIALCMGKIFHYSIKGTHKTAFKEEIAIAKSYLDIQLIRFNDKFEVLYHISPATEQLKVPKMILQPLIENAIFHGLEPKVGKGILYISSILVEGHLQITIQDDGVGILSDMLLNLQASLSVSNSIPPPQTTHLGILNVHNRIFLEYGAPFGLTIESTYGVGTKVIILLPI